MYCTIFQLNCSLKHFVFLKLLNFFYTNGFGQENNMTLATTTATTD